MHSQASQILTRRRHDAEFKTSVIAACRAPGASVAAVAQAHGLNANLVRKWLVGRGLKRCGLQVASTAGASALPPAASPQTMAAMQFLPLQLPAASVQPGSTPAAAEAIEIELTRAGTSLTVRWPAAQAAACASWIGELAAVLAR